MLHIHRSERADHLVDALGDLLSDPLPDPMATEVVSVPTRGVERWLTQRLSGRLGTTDRERTDGVCANVHFPFPGRLVLDALAGATGITADEDPWSPERAVWPLLEVVAEHDGDAVLAPLVRHLQSQDARRFTAVRHVADLYDRYGVHRPGMLDAWHAGRDVFEDGRPLPADAVWQAALWRLLRERIAEPGPAERLRDGCASLEADPDATKLPARVSIFGLTRLPSSYLSVLRAVATHRDVHLFLLHPSGAHWSAGRHEARNPLLESWGRDAREMRMVLGDDHEDHHHAVTHQPGTLLQRIQADAREDRRPTPVELQPHDRSVQVHACHGRARQVEVLRDAILHVLADDPTIEPRDVIVMCPDIEAFAPLVHATFGTHDTDGEARLRVRLADRSIRQTNPVLAVVAELLDLASSRVTATQVLDLAGREPVRRRFRLTDDDLERLETWVAATNTRWGLDAQHRTPYRLEAIAGNTWRAGLDRLLVGVAVAGTLVGDVLPLEDVESTEIDLAGRFAEFVDRLARSLDALDTGQPVDAWARALETAAHLLTDTSDEDAWQRAQLQRVLSEVVEESSGSAQELNRADVGALLADRLRGRPTRANFRTGHLTVCTLVPMRSVPHRVVCLLGLDDGVFPRATVKDGDDLVAADRRPGDRDPRTEDRQLLLDAVMAATDTLVVTYAGRDERTNMPRPPAVPLGELLDVIDATARVSDDTRARDRVVVHHPLQPFDPRNFASDAPWSFDRVALGGARALVADRLPKPPFLGAPLGGVAGETLELDELVRFVQHPARAFLRQRLGVYVGGTEDELADDLPVELDGLEKWDVGQRVLDAHLAGRGLDDCIASERAGGSLPPGRLADSVIAEVRADVERIAEVALRTPGEPETVDVRVTLPGGRVLLGAVGGVRGDVVQSVSFSRLAPKHRLASWVRLLAVGAAHPSRAFEAATVGRARAGVACARIPAVADPVAHLRALVDLYDRGMREPLPLYCKTSAAYALAGEHAGRQEWATDRYAKEDREPEHELVGGGVRAWTDVLAEPPRPGEDWLPGEPSRLAQLAHRLWDGLLACEQVVTE